MDWNGSFAESVAALKRDGFDEARTSSTSADNVSLVGQIRKTVRSPMFLFFVMVALSLPFGLVNLQAPFSGEHEFRQTQTALSVWDMRQYGFSFLHPRLPLFGPPWECPFEYPVFQIAAAAIDSIAPWTSLDVSIRVTNLIFFYLSGLVLFFLARSLFGSWVPAILTLAVFLFSPYNVFWSRSSMIEYAATFSGLAYLFFFIRWTRKPTGVLFCVTLCIGLLGALTKVTTFILPLFATCTIGGLNLLQLLKTKGTAQASGEAASREMAYREAYTHTQSCHLASRGLRSICILLLLVLPVLIGYAYVHYSDFIKEQMDYTSWLSSRHPYTRTWTYGTWEQRLKLRNWNLIWIRGLGTTLPPLGLALCCGVFLLPFRLRRFQSVPYGNFIVGLSLSLAPLIAILLFYNLYLMHSYYFIACVPFFAIFTGASLGFIFEVLPGRFLRTLFGILLIGIGLLEWSGRLGTMTRGSPTVDSRITCLAEVSQIIAKDEPVIIVSPSEWSAFVPYYLKRRAFMAMLVNKPVSIQPLLDRAYFKLNGFRWLLVDGNEKHAQEFAARIMKQWKSAQPIPLPGCPAPYTLYALSDR